MSMNSIQKNILLSVFTFIMSMSGLHAQAFLLNAATEDLGLTNSGRVTASYGADPGSNRIMFVSFTSEDNGDIVTGMSYGGRNLTSIGTSQTGAGWILTSQLFYLTESDIAAVSPATITITTNGGIAYGLMSVVFFENVDQVSPIGNIINLGGNSSPQQTGVMASDYDLIVVAAANNDGATSLTPSAGFTPLHDFSGWQRHAFAYKSITATGSSTSGFSGGTATQFSVVGAEVNGIASPLPIELLSFKLEATADNMVKLDWVTASEINNDFFTIERTTDGEHWEALAHILSKAAIETFPNPTDGLLTIKGESIALDPLKIFNSLGQDVSYLTTIVESNTSKILVDFSKLQPGIYYLNTATTVHKISKF